MNQPGPRGYRWVVLLVLSFANACIIGVFFAAPAVAPFIQADLGINRTQVGLLMAALLVGAAIMATPGGWLADRSIRWTLLSFQGLTAGAILFFSRAATLEQGLAATFCVGIGAGAVLPAMTKAITTWFPFRERATAMGLFFSGASVGTAASAALLPSLSLSLGWRQALLIMALFVLGAGITCFALYRYSPAAPELRPIPIPEAAKERKVAGPSYWNISMLGLVAILLGGPQYAFATYLLLYLKEALYFPVVQAGLFLAVAQGSGLFGRIGWGMVSDRLLGGNRKGVFLIMGTIFTISLSSIAVGLSRQAPLLILMFVIGISGFSWYGIWMTLLAESSGSASGVGMGYGQSLSYLGIIVGPPLFGYLVDTAGSYTPAWVASAVVAGISTVLIILVREARASLAPLAKGAAQIGVGRED